MHRLGNTGMRRGCGTVMRGAGVRSARICSTRIYSTGIRYLMRPGLMLAG
jgi:hypothetical protein